MKPDREEPAPGTYLGDSPCGVLSNSGPNGEPLGCGWPPHGPEREHSWATLPTFPGQYDATANDANTGTPLAPLSGVGTPEEDWTPDELLNMAVQAATRALDRAHADGLVIPPQAAAGVAMLDTTAQLLAAQVTSIANQVADAISKATRRIEP